MSARHGIGIVGLGVIAQAYLETLRDHPRIRIAAVADLDAARAEAVAATLPGTDAVPVDDLHRHPGVQTVLNLTIPAAHTEVALAAIAAGRSVYGEKPLAVTMADADRVIEAADGAVAADPGRRVRVGSAPDTVLGTGTQTARAAIDDGMIGRPTAAVATMVTPGHEAWHPNPDFYYREGGGPLLDMGPYYVTALVHLLGPVRAVVGSASALRDVRTIGSGPRAGEEIPVSTPTHVTGILEHTNGALSTIVTSFDAVATTAAPIEVHGERATLQVPDPNGFAGEVRLRELGADDWLVLEPSAGYVDGARGVGLLDFLDAGTSGPTSTDGREGTDSTAGRANGALARHVLEVMTGVLRSAETGTRVAMVTTTERPAPVPLTPAAAWRA
ncbi:Gfo/Idh/MocA family protein [Curtobacterium sp. RRHDQ10]|uniref:Gfo/Idh/MocA family protein n=1 Tax=Curtobacterium phyllosphaerae TaxID=3413379 RepID=UPI003BF35AD4